MERRKDTIKIKLFFILEKKDNNDYCLDFFLLYLLTYLPMNSTPTKTFGGGVTNVQN